MDDDEEFEEVDYDEDEFEVLAPLPFNGWSVAAHVGFALAGIFSCVGDLFADIGQEFAHAANHSVTRWRAKDEGEKFASEVLSGLAGLDSQG